ncbi:CDC42 small effector protein homolog [Halyomorpha halys]|uniref:CRIB domain-containing protein n=1 Tax=Nezara viridula TaxID=85310 RepID=A0A9P0E9R2_NEZVI|nr:CDC42 small effector protein homolog [Halyomorpha halys]CAH1393425.1 unnamed protein product [Nezara viridula]
MASGYQSGDLCSDLWFQIFSCCINQPPQQKRNQRHARIDRSMIGEPTNFQHTGHIGSGDIELVNSQLRAIQKQMQSKGGYELALAQRSYS